MMHRPARAIFVAFVLVLACASDEVVEHKSRPMAPTAKSEPRSLQPTPRMTALAHVLSGSLVQNEWFTADDIKRTQQLEFASGMTHPRYIDKIKDPAHCAVERRFLNYAGEVERTEVVELDCGVFWRMIRDVDDYYAKWGFLPSSATELDMFLGTLKLN